MNIPLFFTQMTMKELSIFIDESGDFGDVTHIPSHYLVTLVFHEQSEDISSDVCKLENSVTSSGFNIEYIHTGPLIRREDVFHNYTVNERRQLLYKMLNFITSLPIMCETIIVNRKEAPDKISLSGNISRSITRLLQAYDSYFREFDKLIIYYDNGQRDLGAILSAVFSAHYSNVEFRKAAPQRYRLLQVADFICSMELLRIKRNENRLSNSEKMFFYRPQELKKTFLKAIDRKNIRNCL